MKFFPNIQASCLQPIRGICTRKKLLDTLVEWDWEQEQGAGGTGRGLTGTRGNREQGLQGGIKKQGQQGFKMSLMRIIAASQVQAHTCIADVWQGNYRSNQTRNDSQIPGFRVCLIIYTDVVIVWSIDLPAINICEPETRWSYIVFQMIIQCLPDDHTVSSRWLYSTFQMVNNKPYSKGSYIR